MLDGGARHPDHSCALHWGNMKRILAAAVSLAIILVGFVAVPAQAQSLRHPRGCYANGYETSFDEVTELICNEEYTGGGDFSQYTGMTTLQLSYYGYSKITSLPKMPTSLEELEIGELASTDWSAIYALPNLTSLSVYGSATAPDIVRLAKTSPNLESLGLAPA